MNPIYFMSRREINQQFLSLQTISNGRSRIIYALRPHQLIQYILLIFTSSQELNQQFLIIQKDLFLDTILSFENILKSHLRIL